MNPFRPRYHIRDILKFTAIVCAVLVFLSWSGAGLALQADWPMSIIYPLGVAVLSALSIMRPRARYPQCESCGKRFFPTRKGKESGLCPACRIAKVPPEQNRRLAFQGFIIIFILLLMVASVLAFPFAGFMQARLGWFAYLMITIGLFVVLFILCAVGLVLRSLVRMRRMYNPAYALRVARDCAREDGKQTDFGPASVYVFGPDDPTSMLKGQMEICRSRFESLVGESVENQRPLRIFVFGKRNSFDAFFTWAFLYRSNLDGMYVPWSTATISMTTEFPAYRLADLERRARILLAYFNLDSYRESRSPSWLQMGIANLVASGVDEMESARLNRQMLAALSRGDSLGPADFFHISNRYIVRLVRDWRDFDNFKKYSQLTAQSSSVVEFLCSDKERLERFRAFLKDATKKSSIEAVYQRHFDYGFQILLEQWRAWVLHRGIGWHGPPPQDTRDALLERVIPIVLDHGADQLDRIQAIREMGRTGYVLGSDALIDLLGKDDQIPSEEVVWSLESISGLALGDDVKTWTGWFNQLPSDATGVTDMPRHS